MQTARWLKISAVLAAVFVVFWVASVCFFFASHVNLNRTYGEIGGRLSIVWVFVPVLPACVIGLAHSIKERKEQAAPQKRRKLRVLLILLLVCHMILWVTGCVLVVKLSGL